MLKYPAIKAFRTKNPSVHLTWVSGRRPSAFKGRLSWLNDGLIDEIHEEVFHTLRPWSRFPPQISARFFDTVVCTESRLVANLATRRIPHRVFISPVLHNKKADSDGPKSPSPKSSVTSKLSELLSAVCGFDVGQEQAIQLPSHVEEWAKSVLPLEKAYFGLSPGAGGKRKQWPIEYFIELCERIRHSSGLQPVFFLGPEDKELLGHLTRTNLGALFPESLVEQRGQQSTAQTIALARRVEFSVANDSGGGHLVAAGGNPTVTLFGHTDPVKFASPYGTQIALSARDLGVRRLSDISVSLVLCFLQKNGLV